MEALTQLTDNHNKLLRVARANIHGCPVCLGKPHLTYEPGCVYSVCIAKKENCPCIEAAPDMEVEEIVGRINQKMRRDEKE